MLGEPTTLSKAYELLAERQHHLSGCDHLLHAIRSRLTDLRGEPRIASQSVGRAVIMGLLLSLHPYFRVRIEQFT